MISLNSPLEDREMVGASENCPIIYEPHLSKAFAPKRLNYNYQFGLEKAFFATASLDRCEKRADNLFAKKH